MLVEEKFFLFLDLRRILHLTFKEFYKVNNVYTVRFLMGAKKDVCKKGDLILRVT